MSVVESARARVRDLRRWLGMRYRLYRVRAAGNAGLRAVARAIAATLRNAASAEERSWINRIESLRERLRASTTEISVTGYGAGDPGLNLSDEVMRKGRVVTRTIGETCRVGSSRYFWCLLLFKIVRQWRPSVCLELGTSLGISGAYQAAALKLNGAGKLVTLEGADSLAALAAQHFESLGLDNTTVVAGRFQETLDGVLREHGPIDYAFIDGHHDEHATQAYFDTVSRSLTDGAVVAFDDISWSDGMKRAWNAITEHPRVAASLDLGPVGVCVTGTGRRRAFRIPLA
jgi:predicted O-methyltransferase YrrM